MLRGDIHRFVIPRGVGHEQHGQRLAVIVQAQALLPRSVVVVAPTSTSARPASIRPEIVVGGVATKVLVEQIAAIDVERLGAKVGSLTPAESWSIDEALLTVLGLD